MRNPITKQKTEEVRNSNIAIKMIDIRSNHQFQKLHIPGVINIPAETLTDEMKQFSKDETIICICNHGKERSQHAAETLYKAGFTNSFYLVGGTAGWFE